jgi:hypothetical protein
MTIRAMLSRVALLIGGTIVGLLLLEALLQAAALYTAVTRPRAAGQWLRGDQRIVCLGDSNTYGFFLERPAEEAYPHQVQERWNARPGAAPIEVLNLGVPGYELFEAARGAPRNHPDAAPQHCFGHGGRERLLDRRCPGDDWSHFPHRRDLAAFAGRSSRLHDPASAAGARTGDDRPETAQGW